MAENDRKMTVEEKEEFDKESNDYEAQPKKRVRILPTDQRAKRAEMERSRRAQLTTKQKAVRADKERNRRSNTVDQKRMEQKIPHSLTATTQSFRKYESRSTSPTQRNSLRARTQSLTKYESRSTSPTQSNSLKAETE